MAEAPLIKKGKYYFCPECGHLMTRVHRFCPACHLQFKGEIVEDKLRPPQDPDKLAEVEEQYEQVRHLSFVWLSIGAVLLLGALAIIILILLRR
uniref:Uncharacterized protein n=1 Tax=candidate division WOR-3 bacterium TaxID=2052148 RepID=A0A7V3PSC1_UNCW3